jgi:hypothetical protein
MTATATPKASVNGNTAQYGGIITSDGVTPLATSDTVDLARDASTDVLGVVWEIFAYPPAFTCPAGWTDVNDVFTYRADTPPQWTLTHWGKYLTRLTLIAVGGDVSSEALAFSILSPNAGLVDTAPGETDQFETWVP